MQSYLENRIKQNPYNGEILQNSTPVICFGDLFNSKTATLGLNPSNKEFVDNNNNFLSGNDLRFQDCFSLYQKDLTKLGAEETELVLHNCTDYFKINPYRKWFDVLEKNILKKINVSYYNNTCCHLDIVQWATSKKWGEVDKINRDILLNSDYPFLIQQLENQEINLLLVNGISVFNILNEREHLIIQQDETIRISNETCRMIKFYFQKENKNINGIAWSKNIQSSVGLTSEMRESIGNWVKNNRT